MPSHIVFDPRLPQSLPIMCLAEATGRTCREATMCILEVRAWAATHSDDGHFPNGTLAWLANVILGTDLAFWQAAVREGFIRLGDTSEEGMQIILPRNPPPLRRSPRQRQRDRQPRKPS